MSINRNALKSYAPKARREFIAAVAARAAKFGITKSKTVPAQEQGDLVIIGADAYPKRVGEQRQKLLSRIALHGFDQTMEEVAYTWFNRLLAIRFMELHGYLDHGYRVLSHPSEKALPEILEHAEHLDFPGLNRSKVVDLKLDGTKDAELYRLLLIAQCNALHRAMPFLFEKIDDETELLLPDHLLHTDSLIRKLVTAIDEVDWKEIEIIGWLYQFYISEKKDQVIGKVVKSEDIPAATQLFTPNWIVKYMVQNSLGAQWLATYPGSALKAQMEYHVEPAQQTEEVLRQLAATTPKELNPEELTLIDPACGSGHILVEAYNLFKAIYLERGYPLRDVPRLILEKNLFGLDIDDRAAQMAGFALLMRARADDRRILSPDNPPATHVMAIQDSKGLDADEIAMALLSKGRFELVPSNDLLPDTLTQPTLSAKTKSDVEKGTIKALIDLFADGKTFGSLITVPNRVAQSLPALRALVTSDESDGLFQQNAKLTLRPLVQQAELLTKQYSSVVANPPYMGAGSMNPALKVYCADTFPEFKLDTYSAFVARCALFADMMGIFSLVVMHSWMFVFKYEAMRQTILSQYTISNLLHLGTRAFPEISGEVVQTVCFAARKKKISNAVGRYFDLTKYPGLEKAQALLKSEGHEYLKSSETLALLPSFILCYWATEREVALFRDRKPLSTIAHPRHGMVTSDNDRFLRWWWEVPFSLISFGCPTRNAALHSGAKWFPYNKGGGYQKWYGNIGLVINWRNDGEEVFSLARELYGSPSRKLPSQEYYFNAGLTYSALSSDDISMRYNGPGYLFDSKGSSIFPDISGDEQTIIYLLSYLNSRCAARLLNLLCPTLDYNAGSIAKLPLPNVSQSEMQELVKECGAIRSSVKLDWDASELSWDFASFHQNERNAELSLANLNAEGAESRAANKARFLKIDEIFSNDLQIELELLPALDERDFGFRPKSALDYVEGILSYSIGCMMGRYSLVEPGLIYAHSGNEGFDPSRYGAFPADNDGIVPVTESDWFDDDAASRFEQFLRVAWSPEALRENLRFVAEGLSPNGGSDPQKTVRSYFAKSFFKDHLKAYKKRPIYWLFSSGKLKAFECLVYLHRYNESTLSRMRMEYVTPLQSRMVARIDQLSDDITSASSSAARTKAQKEKDLVGRQLEELRAFDEQLRHYADQRIALDLDDGVKVNYGKFGNLLADVKAITGGE